VARIDFALSPAQRADARAALTLLDGTDISLEEAARRAVRGRRALKRIKLEDAIDEFVLSRLTAECRPGTVEWYEKRLSTVAAKFGDRFFDDVDRASFHQWIKEVEIGECTRKGLVRAARALWNWGMSHEPQLVAVDITVGLDGMTATNDGDAEFLTVDEVRAIMAGAGKYRSALALMLFAAIRPEEIAGKGKPPLLWKHVRADEKIIRIPGEIAKTAKPRVIESLPDTVWRFLEPKENESARICDAHSRQAIKAAQAAIERAKWPGDATRHTFGTYAFAAYQDAGKVATWMGHEGKPTMLHRHYRGLSTKAEGEKFFALK
jgi:hypothetical protein